MADECAIHGADEFLLYKSKKVCVLSDIFWTCSGSLGNVLVPYAGGPCSIPDESGL